MKAAIITAAGRTPVYGEFPEPAAGDGMELVKVTAAALSPFSKSRSSGSHYSSEGMFPCVAGADAVGQTADGRRVYFVLPEAPFGALAERSLVRARQCVEVPDGIDDVTAAAIANPGMSGWAALVERAALRPGETVLVNGATGSAGGLAVQIAKYLGAGKVIATGRDEVALEELRGLGADVLLPLGEGEGFEEALLRELAGGIDMVIDYLWGRSARAIIVAIARAVEDGHPVRFVHVGGASREENIELPGAALRSSAIQLMGSGVKSIPFDRLLESVKRVLEVAGPAGLKIRTRTLPLREIEANWNSAGKPRLVFEIG